MVFFVVMYIILRNISIFFVLKNSARVLQTIVVDVEMFTLLEETAVNLGSFR